VVCFFFQAEDGIRDRNVTGVQTCALPIFLCYFLKVSSRSFDCLIHSSSLSFKVLKPFVFVSCCAGFLFCFSLLFGASSVALMDKIGRASVGKECICGLWSCV